MRTAEIKRKTAETDISVSLNIDGRGIGEINTGCGFLDHMLILFAKHGRFDLKISCTGDTYVDYHHTAEDIAICLGKAFREAAADMAGIKRYASIILPMDEALILSAVDISGRSLLSFRTDIAAQKIGDFDTELIKEFMLDGENAHHIAEGCFKALARTLSAALETDERFKDEIPSTKGVLV